MGEYALGSIGNYNDPARAFYPADAKGWTKAIMSDYGAYYLNWLPYEKPSVTTQPKKKTAFPGDTVSFMAAANTYVEYQWYFRKDADSAWTKCSGDSATTDTLEITVKSYYNGYQYRCKMTNPLGTVYSYYASLTVSAPKVTTQPKSVTAAADSTASFSVAAKGVKTYQWYFSKDGGETWSKCSNGSSATFKVEAKSYRSGYLYRCELKNAAGTTYTNFAMLTVLTAPKITTQPKDKTAAKGATVTFTVKASGKELSYQWYFSKDGGSTWSKCSEGTTASLTVEAASYRDGYLYRCKITNPVGSVYSNAATLHVK